MELYDDETDAEVYQLGIHTLEESSSIDPPENMMASLYDRAKELVQTDKFVAMIGGEHSVSGPVIRAHSEKYPNLSVLQIDAHADLRDTYDGTPHSHASIMARVVKDCTYQQFSAAFVQYPRKRRDLWKACQRVSSGPGTLSDAAIGGRTRWKA